MRRFSMTAPLLVGLSVCGASCQRAAPPAADAPTVSTANTPAGAQVGAGAQQPTAPQTQLKVGDPAPDFSLTDTEGQAVKLSDFRGKKNVVLAFYVLAFTGG